MATSKTKLAVRQQVVALQEIGDLLVHVQGKGRSIRAVLLRKVQSW